LGKLLTGAVKVILPQARYKGLVVNTDVTLGDAPWFLGDVHHLRQVLLNLLSNAVKFTERVRSLYVRVLAIRSTVSRWCDWKFAIRELEYLTQSRPRYSKHLRRPTIRSHACMAGPV
jgi:signal transduction histidine kinase